MANFSENSENHVSIQDINSQHAPNNDHGLTAPVLNVPQRLDYENHDDTYGTLCTSSMYNFPGSSVNIAAPIRGNIAPPVQKFHSERLTGHITSQTAFHRYPPDSLPQPSSHQLPRPLVASSYPGRVGSISMSSGQYAFPPPSSIIRLPANNTPLYSYEYEMSRNAPGNKYGNASDPRMTHYSPRVEVAEPDSSSSVRDVVSHINRKKRKACGRCGPCQRKDNCGTCMNCINRAKGKQICIYRKCEELKKKPGTDIYPQHCDQTPQNVQARQEKRKDLEHFLSNDRKRSKTDDSSSSASSSHLGAAHPEITHQIPSFAPLTNQQNFNQQQYYNLSDSGTQSYSCPVSKSNQNSDRSDQLPFLTHQNESLSAHLPGTSARVKNSVQPNTTDIISEALREIENHSNTDGDTVNVTNLQQSTEVTREEETSKSYHNLQQKKLPPSSQEFYSWNQQYPPLNTDFSVTDLQGNRPNLPELQSSASAVGLLSNITSPETQPDHTIIEGTQNECKQDSTTSRSSNEVLLSGINPSVPNYAPNSGNQYYRIPSQEIIKDSESQTTIAYSKMISVSEPATGCNPLLTVSNTNKTVIPPVATMHHNPDNISGNSYYSSVNPGGMMINRSVMSQSNYQHYLTSNYQRLLTPSTNYHMMAPLTNTQLGYLPTHQSYHRPQLHGTQGYFPTSQLQSTALQQSYDSHMHSTEIKQPILDKSTSVSNTCTVSLPNSNQNHPVHSQGIVKLPQHQGQPLAFEVNQSLNANQGYMLPNHSSYSRNYSPATRNQDDVSRMVAPAHPAASFKPYSPMISTPGGTYPNLSSTRVPPIKDSTTEHVNVNADTTRRNQAEKSLNVGAGSFSSVPVMASNVISQPDSAKSDTTNSQMKPFLVYPGSSNNMNNVTLQMSKESVNSSLPNTSFNKQQNDCTMHPHHLLSAARFEKPTDTPSVFYSHTPTTTSVTCSQLFHPTVERKVQFSSNNNMSTLSVNAVQSVKTLCDTNLTISPGESGYDSNEIPTVSEDARYVNETVSEQSSSVKLTSSPCDFGAESLLENGKEESGPKNLYRAPVDTRVWSNQDNFKLDLLAAGASAHNFPFSISRSKSNTCKNSMKRCLSFEDWNRKELQKTKLPINARRYSYQDEKSLGEDRRFLDQKPKASDQSLTMEKEREMNRMRNIFDTHQSQPYLKTETPGENVCSNNHLSFSPMVNENVRSNKTQIHTFDTPPMTPSNESSNKRVIQDSQSPINKISDILPTPPYVTETNAHWPTTGPIFTSSENASGHGPSLNMQNADMHGFTENANITTEFPACDCIVGSDGRDDDAPYYTHLGAAATVAEIRKLFEERTGYTQNALRIEKVIYTGKEGKTSYGCPIAKWIIRRTSEEEKVLVICRQRPKHHCKNAVTVVVILLWDGVAGPLANFAYSNFSTIVPKHGEPTVRRCGTNDEKTCACQGFDENTCGASFSFGCSWSMYYNGCKFARSAQPNKYKLTATKDAESEKFVSQLCEKLATVMSPLYKMAAPDAFQNQVENEQQGFECRLGENEEENSRPFSGVTACLDFCAHAHKDQHNMINGSTIVLTLTKPELRKIGIKPADEQLHVLPLYKLDLTNEQGEREIVKNGVEILHGYRREVRMRSEPQLSKRQKARAKKKFACDDLGSPPYKRKGRPPKRTRSVENLQQMKTSPIRSSSLAPNSFANPENMNRCFQTPPHIRRYPPSVSVNSYHSVSNNSYLPTRWPYREHSIASEPQSSPNPPMMTPLPINENLPSIGSFFTEASSVANNPTAPVMIMNGLMKNSHGTIQNPTPLPSINDVVSHPFYETFAALGNAPVPTNCQPHFMHHRAAPTPSQSGMQEVNSPFHQQSPHAREQTGLNETSNRDKVIYSDSEENFLDSEIGGVAIAPGHGSVLIECAKKELHATTPLLRPNRFNPSRISLVFYQHKSLNCRNHGSAEYGAKEEKRQQKREEKKAEELSRTKMDHEQRSGSASASVGKHEMAISNLSPMAMKKDETLQHWTMMRDPRYLMQQRHHSSFLHHGIQNQNVASNVAALPSTSANLNPSLNQNIHYQVPMNSRQFPQHNMFLPQNRSFRHPPPLNTAQNFHRMQHYPPHLPHHGYYRVPPQSYPLNVDMNRHSVEQMEHHVPFPSYPQSSHSL